MFKRPRPRTIAVLGAPAVLVFSLLLLTGIYPSLLSSPPPVSEADIVALTADEMDRLEGEYAPVLQFSGDERIFPVEIDYYLDRSRLFLVSDREEEVIDRPSISDLTGQCGPECYLDAKGGAYNDLGTVEVYEDDLPEMGYQIYSRSFQAGEFVIIQYWFFYVFNDGAYNRHEGDWEMVQVVLQGADRRPVEAMASKHRTSSYMAWDRIEKAGPDGNHPLIYVAKGSHANYLSLDSNLMSGDQVDDLGPTLGPQDYTLIPMYEGTDRKVPLPWLGYGGLWGERAGALGNLMGNNGPLGPMFREGGAMWAGLEGKVFELA